jgi:hypothetical protein
LSAILDAQVFPTILTQNIWVQKSGKKELNFFYSSVDRKGKFSIKKAGRSGAQLPINTRNRPWSHRLILTCIDAQQKDGHKA